MPASFSSAASFFELRRPSGRMDRPGQVRSLSYVWGHEGADRLTASRNYWLATTRPDGRPHAAFVVSRQIPGTRLASGIQEVRDVAR